MDFIIKNKFSLYSLVIVISLNFLGIFFQMTRADYSILLFSHIIIFIIYLLNLKTLLEVINHKIIIVFFAFIFFSILINHLIHVGFNIEVYNFSAYKLFFVSILHNFLLGGLLVKSFNNSKKIIPISFPKNIIVLIFFLCLYVAYETFFLTPFEENVSRVIFKGNNNLYQTFADYFSRLVIMLVFLNEYIFRFKNKKINTITGLILVLGFLFISVSGSAKGPLFLLFIAGFLFFHFPKIIKTLCFLAGLYVLFYINILDIFNPRFFTSALYGLTNRLDFFENYLDLFLYNPILGSLYSHDTLGVDYIHSSILSSFTGLGIVGGGIFVLINIDLLKRGIHLGGFLKYLIVIVILISNAATYFDWFLFWFCCGIIYNANKLVYD
tara:strand:- start:14735 stop:15880 length:1146 start_codon:yes stop_codon:yes gene_type:complete